jgi:hypothetical protein
MKFKGGSTSEISLHLWSSTSGIKIWIKMETRSLKALCSTPPNEEYLKKRKGKEVLYKAEKSWNSFFLIKIKFQGCTTGHLPGLNKKV